MTKRPLIQKGVAELEMLFDQKREDLEFLEFLVLELSERRTQRAQDLKKRAIQAIGVRSKHPSSEAQPKPAPAVEDRRSAPAPQSDGTQSVVVAFDGRPPAAPPAGQPAIAPTYPPISNRPEEILSAWTAMEVLSPPSFRKPEDLTNGDRYRVAIFKDQRLPWDDVGEKSRPNQRLYYQIILGSIDMETAVSALLQVYSDSRVERPQARGEAVLATIMVDRQGRPVEDDAIAISSFGWGIPVALSGRLRELGRWSAVEKALRDELTEKVTIEDEDGNPCPLTSPIIDGAYHWLVETLGLDARFVKSPTFAIRSYQYFKLQDPPETILLNSFYLDDLAQARTLVIEGNVPSNLKRHLGAVSPRARRNLMKDSTAISNALEPAKFPLGSWPGIGRPPFGHASAMRR